MLKLLLLTLGGAVGTLARYGTGVALRDATAKTAFPCGTLAVNLIGCLLIGYLHGIFIDRWPVRDEYRAAMIIGFLGGFTTFSAFGLDTALMLRSGETVRAGINILGNNVLGIALVLIGYGLARVGN
jgi:CrcB protein